MFFSHVKFLHKYNNITAVLSDSHELCHQIFHIDIFRCRLDTERWIFCWSRRHGRLSCPLPFRIRSLGRRLRKMSVLKKHRSPSKTNGIRCPVFFCYLIIRQISHSSATFTLISRAAAIRTIISSDGLYVPLSNRVILLRGIPARFASWP